MEYYTPIHTVVLEEVLSDLIRGRYGTEIVTLNVTQIIQVIPRVFEGIVKKERIQCTLRERNKKI